MFGGAIRTWRGPIWFPINFLIIESLQKFYHYYGDDFLVECPTGSGRMVTILEVSRELTRRLTRLFTKDASGRRVIFGAHEKLSHDPLFQDKILFFEYFHGDKGWGLQRFPHQTGWTGLIAKLLMPSRERMSAVGPGVQRRARDPKGPAVQTSRLRERDDLESAKSGSIALDVEA